MAIATDFEIQADKDIRAVSGTENYSVYELHQWLQGLADDASYSGDDVMDITQLTPSEKLYYTIITLLNGYNIDDTTAQRLYGGSIIQDGGDEIYDGIQVLAPAGMYLQIIQNGALATNFWTTGINADAPNGISHQFILKVRTGGADIDGRRLIGITREFGYNFLEFKINGTGRGVNVMAFTGWGTDLNNQTTSGTVATWTTITNESVGYNGIDVNNDSVNEYYYSKWNRASYSINQLYERLKYLARRATSETLYGLNGELFRGITHEIDVDNPSTTDFNAYEAISWSGGTGQMLAINDVNNPTKMWIQLLTGVAPTDGQTITGGGSGATCDVNTNVTERPVSAPFCGVSTGTSIIGAYGLGVEALDLSNLDKVTDLTNTVRQAPNYQQGVVAGLVNGEDYVLVAPNDGGDIDYDQLTLQTTLNGGSVTSVVCTTSIPADTPSSGTIRIQLDNGKYRKISYTGWSGSTFTIPSTSFVDPNDATAGNNIFVSYIDKLADATSLNFTSVYGSPRSMFIRARDGGSTPIKTFETTATFGSGGFSVTISRISDS